MVKSEDQDWTADKPEGSYRFPSRWLEERGDWLKDGRPVKADIEAIADAEKVAAQMEVDFSRKEGFIQRVKSMDGLKLEDKPTVIDCDEVEDAEEMGASNEDRLDPKAWRRLKKAEALLKDGDAMKSLGDSKSRDKDEMKKARKGMLKEGGRSCRSC